MPESCGGLINVDGSPRGGNALAKLIWGEGMSPRGGGKLQNVREKVWDYKMEWGTGKGVSNYII